ncbi:MAG: hypothetical protein HFI09_02725 [Bacilli bacterium]|nr:hypothetical protein [Bacilli bacterium]
MKFRKTLFFEIPSKDFIMPVYTEDDVNTLKSFLDDDEVQFSIGFKTEEDAEGYYFIGQVKEFTDIFCLKDFPAIYRKRVIDILNGLNEKPIYISVEEEMRLMQMLVYFKMTKKGPKVFITDYNEENLEKLEKQDISDYYVKEIPAYIIGTYEQRSHYTDDEIFYKIKNPNF